MKRGTSGKGRAFEERTDTGRKQVSGEKKREWRGVRGIPECNVWI